MLINASVTIIRHVTKEDLAGNLTQRVDATGATANDTYDALDRVLTAAYPAAAAENVAYKYVSFVLQYDTASRPTSNGARNHSGAA